MNILKKSKLITGALILIIGAANIVLAGPKPPNPVRHLHALALSHTQIYFTWLEDGNFETGYRIERAENGLGPWVFIDSVPANVNIYFDKGLTPNKAYFYRAVAYNEVGHPEMHWSWYVSTKTWPDTGKPSAASHLAAESQADRVKLSWIDGATGESGFQIYRDDQLIATINQPDTTSYEDRTAPPASLVIYRVDTFNNVGATKSFPLSFKTAGASNCSSLFSGGDGTESNPLIITTAEQLRTVNSCLDKHFALGANLDMAGSGSQFVLGSPNYPFSESFNGKGHSISNFSYVKNESFIGLFSTLEGARIENLKILNINLDGDSYLGGLAGQTFGSRITNVHVSGSIKGKGTRVGGIVGEGLGAVIYDSSIDANVSGSLIVGGIAATASAVVRCSSKGQISGSYSVGGIVGDGYLIDQCSSEAQVTGGDYHSTNTDYGTGGIVGSLSGYPDPVQGTVSNSIFTGRLMPLGAAVGEIAGVLGRRMINCYNAGIENHPAVGMGKGGLVVNSFQANDNPGWVRVGSGVQIINSKTLRELRNIDHFYHKMNNPLSLWDFTYIWEEQTGGFPKLKRSSPAPASLIGIYSHTNNQVVRDRIVNVTGWTRHGDDIASLTVNGNFSSNTGGFFVPIILNPGDNLITVEATAKNAEKSKGLVQFHLTYHPVGQTSDTTPPSAPSGLHGRNEVYNNMTLYWQPSSDNVGVVGYIVYVDNKPYQMVTGTQLIIQGLDDGSSYLFHIVAFDAAGNLSAPSDVYRRNTRSFDDVPPLSVTDTTPDYFPLGTKEAPVTVRTDRPARCFYGDRGGFPATDQNRMDQTDSLDHSILITGLHDEDVKSLYIFCQEQTPHRLNTSDDVVITFRIAYSVANFIITKVGSGSIVRDDGGTCSGEKCFWTMTPGGLINLRPIPASGYHFESWGQSCAGAAPEFCRLNVAGTQLVTATFAKNPTNHLSVEVSVGGSVTGDGLSCSGSICQGDYDPGTTVNLNPVPEQGYQFVNWSNYCTGNGPCNLIMDSDKILNANFSTDLPIPQDKYNLRVNVAGQGTVTINGTETCSAASCDFSYDKDTSLRLTAEAGANFTFSGWDQSCSGAGVCDVTMAGERSVRAVFSPVDLPPKYFDVTFTYDSGGLVGGTGLTCNNGTCTGRYFEGTVLTLNGAAQQPEYKFDGWSGACTGVQGCQLTMDEDKQGHAAFSKGATPPQYHLLVSVDGKGSVNVNDAVCSSSSCDYVYNLGAAVRLTAIPDPSSYFVRWEEACGGNGLCNVTMSEPRMVRAVFEDKPSLPDDLLSGDSSVDFKFDPFTTVFDGTKDNKMVIRFDLSERSNIRISIFNRQGLIRSLFEGDKSQGPNEISWDTKDDRGNLVGSGPYKIRLSVGGSSKDEGVVIAR